MSEVDSMAYIEGKINQTSQVGTLKPSVCRNQICCDKVIPLRSWSRRCATRKTPFFVHSHGPCPATPGKARSFGSCQVAVSSTPTVGRGCRYIFLTGELGLRVLSDVK